MRCAECGGGMRTTVTRKQDGHVYSYYACANRRDGRARLCINGKTLRAERAEPAVWGLVSDLLCDPDRLRSGLDAMIERERAGDRGTWTGRRRRGRTGWPRPTACAPGTRTSPRRGS